MAKIIGDHTGTTFKDFLILPGHTTSEHLPRKVDISTNLGGVIIQKPYLVAAMRAVVGRDMALAAAKNGIMAVVPRAISTEEAVDIIRYVKENKVEIGEIESVKDPVCIRTDAKLGDAIKKVKKYGHSNIPVVDQYRRLKGVFKYDPLEHEREDAKKSIKEFISEIEVLPENENDDEIKKKMQEKRLRIAAIVDENYHLTRLVFSQQKEAYKIGAAIDTHEGWQDRAHALIEAGADIIFTDTADADTEFAVKVVEKFKEDYDSVICAGNIVTPEAFKRLADAGADIIKLGMGPGSICETNAVLGIGAPPFWSLVEVAKTRDSYKKYVPIIADGGMTDTWDVNVALTHADAIMSGRLFAGCEESAGKKVEFKGKIFKEYWGEASPKAFSDKRYGIGGETIVKYQGVEGYVPYVGLLKPVLEEYTKATKLALSHVGAENLCEYRKKAVLIRLSEKAKEITGHHGILIG